MLKFIAEISNHTQRFLAASDKKKIGTSLIILFCICTVTLIVLPVLYVFFFTSNFSTQTSLNNSSATGLIAITDPKGKIVYASSSLIENVIITQAESQGSYNTEGYTIQFRTLPDGNAIHNTVVPTISNTMFFLATAVYVIIFILIVYIIKKKVYNPITKVEQVLHGVVKGETNFNFTTKESDPFFPMFSDLNILFENIKTLMLRESNAQLIKKQAELDALQSQINPHFLYNTLDAIRGQAIEYGLQDIELMTRALSRLFRYSISNHSTLVTLREELENVDNYLFIQHLRFNNKFLKTSHIDEDALGYKVPKLIIQPIVENAIYHGLEMKIGQGQIDISAHLTKTRLVISIRDDGLGISEDKLKELNASLAEGITQVDPSRSKNSSVGLRNVNARIRLTYGKEFGISIYSTKNIGTDVQLSLPLIQ